MLVADDADKADPAPALAPPPPLTRRPPARETQRFFGVEGENASRGGVTREVAKEPAQRVCGVSAKDDASAVTPFAPVNLGRWSEERHGGEGGGVTSRLRAMTSAVTAPAGRTKNTGQMSEQRGVVAPCRSRYVLRWW